MHVLTCVPQYVAVIPHINGIAKTFSPTEWANVNQLEPLLL